VRGRRRHVHVARFLDRLAVVERLEHRQLTAALLDGSGNAEQVLAPFGARQRRPRPVEGPAGRGHRIVHVGRAGLADLGQRLLVGRVDRFHPLAGAVAELTVHEDLIARTQPGALA